MSPVLHVVLYVVRHVVGPLLCVGSNGCTITTSRLAACYSTTCVLCHMIEYPVCGPSLCAGSNGCTITTSRLAACYRCTGCCYIRNSMTYSHARTTKRSKHFAFGSEPFYASMRRSRGSRSNNSTSHDNRMRSYDSRMAGHMNSA